MELRKLVLQREFFTDIAKRDFRNLNCFASVCSLNQISYIIFLAVKTRKLQIRLFGSKDARRLVRRVEKSHKPPSLIVRSFLRKDNTNLLAIIELISIILMEIKK